MATINYNVNNINNIINYNNNIINVNNNLIELEYLMQNFIHFETREETNLFKRSHSNLHYGHYCCGGKGVLVYNKTMCELNDLKEQFISNSVEKKIVVKDVDGECGICYDIKPLIQTDCFHTFCEKCISEWIKKSDTCPMCRSIIN